MARSYEQEHFDKQRERKSKPSESKGAPNLLKFASMISTCLGIFAFVFPNPMLLTVKFGLDLVVGIVENSGSLNSILGFLLFVPVVWFLRNVSGVTWLKKLIFKG